MYCRSFLYNYEHPSREAETERVIELLHKATAVKAEEPPALGISVSDSMAIGDKPGG